MTGQTLEGRVTDESGGQPIPFATISVFSGEQLLDGTTATVEGRFRMKLPRGSTHLEVSFLAYQNQRLDLPLNSPVQIRLKELGGLQEDVWLLLTAVEYRLFAPGKNASDNVAELFQVVANLICDDDFILDDEHRDGL
ncbi:MAG: hypothetical protein ACI81P_001371 [Neolewinella sp.]|jgi:hypothetical protein